MGLSLIIKNVCNDNDDYQCPFYNARSLLNDWMETPNFGGKWMDTIKSINFSHINSLYRSTFPTYALSSEMDYQSKAEFIKGTVDENGKNIQ